MARFEAHLDPPLPARIAVGTGLAILVRGAYRSSAELPIPVAVELGDRIEPLRAVLHPTPGEDGRFWAIIDVPGTSSGRLPLSLIGSRSRGDVARASLGSIELIRAPSALPAARAKPSDTIAICLATFEPDPVLFLRQIESLRKQTHCGWCAIVSDDASSAKARELIRRVIGPDERFTVVWNKHRLGSYGNFERALTAVPDSVKAIAFCDQDDFWYPEKLQRSEAALAAAGGRGLVCSDARIVTPEAGVVSETFWSSRRHLPGDMRSITVANSVPGCLALWDSTLRDLTLPFPPGFETLHHDGWVASVAASTAGVHRIAQPLADHVQHDANVVGHQGAVDRRIARLGRRDLVAMFVWRGSRRAIAALQIDAALRPEALARTIWLRRPSCSPQQLRAIEHAARSDERLGRIAGHVRRAIEAQVRGGLPGTELAVARGLLAARLTRSSISRQLFG